MISLAGRWTAVQICALDAAGWLNGLVVYEATLHNDSCSWFVIGPRYCESGRQH